MKLVRVLFPVAMLAALLWSLGAASAQSTPTPTSSPSTCMFEGCAASGTAVDCRNGGQPRPSTFGVSGSNYNSLDGKGTCCTGSFGALVQDTNSNLYALSANHVMARASSTTRGAARGELIVQPGLLDIGCFQDATEQVAKLSKWIPLNFSGPNTVDAAIAQVVNGGLDPSGTIKNVGTISGTTFPVSSLVGGMFVMKMGRETCLTLGQIDAFDATGKVTYPKGGGALSAGTALFEHQVMVIGAAPPSSGATPGSFVMPGDSGAVVVTVPAIDGPSGGCPQAIGLIFASNQSGTIVAVNPIDRVLSALKVSLVGECTGPILSAEQGAMSSAEQGPASGAFEAPSAAFRRSSEQVRAVKDRYAHSLLKLDTVVAVGIGAGDDSDHAALVVYTSDDSGAADKRIPARISGVPVKVRSTGGFSAQQACGPSPFSPP